MKNHLSKEKNPDRNRHSMDKKVLSRVELKHLEKSSHGYSDKKHIHAKFKKRLIELTYKKHNFEYNGKTFHFMVQFLVVTTTT